MKRSYDWKLDMMLCMCISLLAVSRTPENPRISETIVLAYDQLAGCI